MQVANIRTNRRTRGIRTMFRVTAVLLASALAFASGYLMAEDVEFVSRSVVIVGGSIAAILIALQMLAQLLLLARSEQTEATALRSIEELESMHLTSRLAHALGRESSRRRIAAVAADFATAELAASSATIWALDSEDLPLPLVSRSPSDDVAERLRQGLEQRTVQAHKAVQSGAPQVVNRGTERSSTLEENSADSGDFTLFLPLLGEDDCYGVLEIEPSSREWQCRHWDLLPSIGRQVGVALERASIYEEMQRRADIDFVSGVYNHRFMHSYLDRVITAVRKRGRCAAVVFLDIDNFKAFNDSLGHGVGDRVLQTVANQLRLMTDRVGVVGRSGGDEFMIVLPYHNAAQTRALIGAFQDWLSISAPPVSGMFRIQVSCGYAVFPDDADSGQELLAAADARLYRAKTQAGRHSVATSGSGNGPGERTLGVYGLLDQIIGNIHQTDNYTRLHCEKTSDYAAAFAQLLNLSPTAHRILRLAALLHDVGKVGVPEHILCKPGPLSPLEQDVVKHQLKISTQLIVDVPNADEVRAVVRHHRERWDGGGYPDGLVGEDIPYLSRVLAVADAYAAITLDRPYRAALSPRDAYEELRSVAGSQLDPQLVHIFEGVVKADPNSRVEAKSTRRAS